MQGEFISRSKIDIYRLIHAKKINKRMNRFTTMLKGKTHNNQAVSFLSINKKTFIDKQSQAD